jgi:hypothetical protein
MLGIMFRVILKGDAGVIKTNDRIFLKSPLLLNGTERLVVSGLERKILR